MNDPTPCIEVLTKRMVRHKWDTMVDILVLPRLQ